MFTRTTLAAALAAALLSVAGCSDDPTSPSGGSGEAAGTALGHIHGVAVDPGNGTLYVASHFGVFRVAEGATPERVADRWQDTMGFAVVGPGHFLASGHPDLREDNLPTSLGLIESTDGAETWEPLSLQGDADFHAIEAVQDRIYAYDSHTGALLLSNDRKTWDAITQQPLYDLASNPQNPRTVYATTEQGELVASTNGAAPVAVEGAPALTGIDWQPDGPLVGIAPDGTVMVSNDARDWDEAGSLDGPAEAIDAIAGRWHAATESGVYESTDDGATWRLVLTADP